jgi:hypothetical protein
MHACMHAHALAACWQLPRPRAFSADRRPPSGARAGRRDTLFWMVANIPGTDWSQGDTVVEWMPPEPGKGRHR